MTQLTVGRVNFNSSNNVLQFPSQEKQMRKHHFAFCVILLLAAYLVGVKFPGAGRTALSKIGL